MISSALILWTLRTETSACYQLTVDLQESLVFILLQLLMISLVCVMQCHVHVLAATIL